MPYRSEVDPRFDPYSMTDSWLSDEQASLLQAKPAPLMDVLRGAAAPAGLTYQAVSTPDERQARQLFDQEGNVAGPVEFAWHNPTLGWDGTSAGGIGDAGNVRFAADSPGGANWTKMSAKTSDFMDPGLGLMLALATASAGAGMAGYGAGAAGAGVAPEVGALYSGLDATAATAGANAASATPSWMNWLAQAPTGTMTDAGGVGEAFEGFDPSSYQGTDIPAADLPTGTTTAPKPNFSIPGYGDVYGGSDNLKTLQQILGIGGGVKTLTNPGGSTINIGPGSSNATQDPNYLGAVLPSLIGAIGSSQQASAIKELAAQQRADRMPFLNQANAWMTNPQSYYDGPGKQSMDAVLRGLSVNGNPIGSGTSLSLATEAGMRDWRNAVQGFGNIGLGGENTQANLGLKGIDAQGGIWDAAGIGASKVLNKPRTLADILGELNGATGGGFKFSLA